MKRIKVREQGRMAASLALSMAVVGGLAAATVGPAESAEPAGDCAEAFPVADLVDGAAVDGTTVSEGTTPEPFTGEILGVMEDGIAPGLDMVLARLSSPAIAEAGGIWQGMSGSPVYAEDGRLIGAVAYGLSWGPSPIAGITPFEEMDDYLAPPPARVQLDDATARKIARATDLTARQADEARLLRMPFGVSGFGVSDAANERLAAARAEQQDHRAKYLPKNVYAMGGTASAAADPGAGSIVAGGNLAVAQSYGDITFGGVGTATSVCDGRVVGFGHPATFLGETTMTMHPADALFVQPESLGAPFKVANLGAPVGTITDDHTTGVTGTFGALPDETTITSDLTYLKNGRQRTGSSKVSTPAANASVTFYQQLANHDRVLDGIVKGSELMDWTITGDDNGSPFTIGTTDRYASNYDIAFEAPWEVADIVYFLSGFEGVTVDSVEVGAQVSDDSSTWQVKRVEQKQRGTWTTVNRRTPALATAGDTLRLRVRLDGPGDDSLVVPLAVDVPRNAKRSGRLEVTGGGWLWTDYWGAGDVDDIEKALADSVRNDQVAAVLSFDSRRTSVTRRGETAPTDRVVTGRKRVDVRVR
jgi:hypothetical protein